MYILPMLTHLEVVALGERSDISPDQHLNGRPRSSSERSGVIGPHNVAGHRARTGCFLQKWSA